MPPKLSIAPREDTCEGSRSKAKVIQLSITPKLHAIEGGQTTDTTETHHESTIIDDGAYAPYIRPNIGVGHHNAQRPWEIQGSARKRVAGILIDGTYLEHLDHKILAATTTIQRADGVIVTVELTHNAYEKLTGTRLRVPTDIGEYDY